MAHLAWKKGVCHGRAAFGITFQHKTTFSLNIFAPGLIQVVRAKIAGSHVTLRENFSGPVSATDLVKSSKDLGSLEVCSRKKLFLVGGCMFFVSYVISGGLLGRLGPLHLTQAPNRSMVVFR